MPQSVECIECIFAMVPTWGSDCTGDGSEEEEGVAIRGGSLWRRRRRRGGGWRFVSTTVCQLAKPVAISLVHIILHSTHQPPMVMVATVILFNWKIVLLQKFSVQISCLMITKRALSTSCVCLSYLAIVWRMEDLLQLNTQRKATKCRAFVVKPGLGCCSTLLVVVQLLIWYKSNHHLLGSYHHHHYRKSTTLCNSVHILDMISGNWCWGD